MDWVREHARRYMAAVYGPNVGFRALETFDNALERWLLAVSSNDSEQADKEMAFIERKAAELRGE